VTTVNVRLERDGDVAVIRLVNTAKLNPLTVPMQVELRAALAEVRGDPSYRSVLLTGEGKGFCVGADLSGMGRPDGDPRTLGAWTADMMTEQSTPLVLDLRSMPVPVVCGLNGAAAGAGVGLALAADVVVAARSAYFLMPFVPKLGLVPDLGSTWFLERLVGRSRATALTLLGERLSAEEAARWGLVWLCVDDADFAAQSLALAQRLARLPAHGIGETRRAYDSAASSDLATQLAYETGRQREMIDRPEFLEGVAAFQQKREPSFAPRKG